MYIAYFVMVYFMTDSISDHTMPTAACLKNKLEKIWKKVLSWNLLTVTEVNHENPQSEQSTFQLRFKIDTF
jgi:hypothetical protein